MTNLIPFYQLFERKGSEELHLTDSFYLGEIGIQLQLDTILISSNALKLEMEKEAFPTLLQRIQETELPEEIQNLGGKKLRSILIFIQNFDLQRHLFEHADPESLINIYQKHKILFYLPSYRFLLGSEYHPKKQSLVKRVIHILNKEAKAYRSFSRSVRQNLIPHTFKLRLITELIDFRISHIQDLLGYFESQLEINSYFEELYLDNLKDLHDRKLVVFNAEAIPLIQESLKNIYSISELENNLTDYENKTEDLQHLNPVDRILHPMKEKPKVLNKVLSASRKLKKVEKLSGSEDETSEFSNEVVYGGVQSQLRLRNAKYRSNASMRSGKLLLTDQRLIAYHRKLSFFPMIPYFAYVRINNRVIFILQQIASYLGAIRPILSGIARTAGPALAGLFLALFGKLEIHYTPSFLKSIVRIPSIRYFLNLSVENPRLFAATVSMIGGFSYGFVRLIRILFYRSRAISIVTYSMIQEISSQDKYFRTKNQGPVLILKPKGSDIFPGIKSGLPFRLNLRSGSFGGIPSYLQDELFAIKLGIIPYIDLPTFRNVIHD